MTHGAYFASSLQMASYHLDALDANLTDFRRAMCAGLKMRSFFTFFSQLPSPVALKTDRLSHRALGTIMRPEGEGPNSEMPAAREGEGADE